MLKNKIDQYSTPQHRIPFWLIVQMSESRSLNKKTDHAGNQLQVYSAIAYGAKGIVYYTLVEPQPWSARREFSMLPPNQHRSLPKFAPQSDAASSGTAAEAARTDRDPAPSRSQQRIWPNKQKGLQAFKRRATTEEYNSSRAGEQIVRDIQGTHSERALVSVMAPKQGRERYFWW
jgi:hypothetical protein